MQIAHALIDQSFSLLKLDALVFLKVYGLKYLWNDQLDNVMGQSN